MSWLSKLSGSEKMEWFAAINRANADEVRRLLAGGIDPNITNDDGETALYKASANDDKEVVRLLLEAKVDVNAANKEGKTPLQIASLCACETVVKLLLEAGASVNVACGLWGKTPLTDASGAGKTDVVQLLLEAGANVNVASTDIHRLFTPLSVASSSGYAEIVELLLKAGADINFPDKDRGDYLLRLASEEGYTEVVRLLKAAVAIPLPPPAPISDPTPLPPVIGGRPAQAKVAMPMTTREKVQLARWAQTEASRRKEAARKRADELKGSGFRGDDPVRIVSDYSDAMNAVFMWTRAEMDALVAARDQEAEDWERLNESWEKATGEKLFKEMEAVVFVAGRGIAAGRSIYDGFIPIAPEDLIPSADRVLDLNGELVALNERKALELEDASPVTDDSGWNAFLSHHPRCSGRKFRASWFNTPHASYCVVVMS